MSFLYHALHFIKSYPHSLPAVVALIGGLWRYIKRLFRRNRKKRSFGFDLRMHYRSKDE